MFVVRFSRSVEPFRRPEFRFGLLDIGQSATGKKKGPIPSTLTWMEPAAALNVSASGVFVPSFYGVWWLLSLAFRPAAGWVRPAR